MWKKAIIFILSLLISFQNVNSDILSINQGGDEEIVITINPYIEGFFSRIDYAPYSGGNQGITDTTSYWFCDAADCSSKCQAEINDGLITGCS